MKLLVKTLKGEKFHVECEGTNSVAEVKGIIVSDLWSADRILDRADHGVTCVGRRETCRFVDHWSLTVGIERSAID